MDNLFSNLSNQEQIASEYSGQCDSFLCEDANCFGYDNVFLCNSDQDEKMRLMMQDWNSFGIVDSSLVSLILTKSGFKDNICPDTSLFRNNRVLSQNILLNTKTQIESECRENISTDSKDSKENESGCEMAEILPKKVFKIAKVLSGSLKLDQNKINKRFDCKVKSSIRFIKTFIKKLFKSMNCQIVYRRYVNCSVNKIFDTMRLTLQAIVPEELLVDDLVYYTIGILKIKKPSQMNCKQKIKREISEFNETNLRFNYKKLKKIMQSNCLRVLCRSIIPKANKSISGTLEQVLDCE
ncbi:unnamed protein product [Moneuplotes crassus]|uniref:Uncharacterized protein n=1 Tax=Euplotes crassus TaxID=5936 RepID=A0AAD2D0M3_EUPCR|nr:unnamed protein product [Moneuplotes crassus]